MRHITTSIYNCYLQAREQIRQQAINNGELDYARKIAECSVFRGNEGIKDLVAVAFTPQGSEFVTRYGFPSIDDFRKMDSIQMRNYGVYIDRGMIGLTNEEQVLIVGNTKATINCDTIGRYKIIVMHGAKATINASNYAVVKVETDNTAEIVTNVINHAKIIGYEPIK